MTEAPVCVTCPKSLIIVLAIVGSVILGCLFVAGLVSMKLSKSDKYLKNLNSKEGLQVRMKSILSVVQRMVLSHMQVLSVIGDFDFKWPVNILTMFSISRSASSLNVVSSGLDFTAGIKCLLYLPSLPDSANEVLIQIYQLSGLVIIVCFFWLIVAMCRRKGETLYQRFYVSGDGLSASQSLIVSLITVVYMMYSSFVKSFWQLFSCVKYDLYESGSSGIPVEYRLQGSLDIVCYGKEHMTLLIEFALPVLLLVLLALPLFSAHFIFSTKRKVKASMVEKESKGPEVVYPLNKEEVNLKVTWGFLYEGYKEKYW